MTSMRRTVFILFVLLSTASQCHGDILQNILPKKCTWSTCNVIGYDADQLSGYVLDCCTLQLPLNHAKPGRTIAVSMSRLRPAQSLNTKNTVFILAGGPGESGWIVLLGVIQLIPASSGITLILPDQRGTGLSTLLGCDETNSQDITANCLTYLTSKFGVEGLKQFSLTSSAHDLGMQIRSYRLQYFGRIGIYGASAGTQWLDRFLQIYPKLVQSAVMDGVLDPLWNSVSRTTVMASVIGVQLLTYCQMQPECNKYFPADQPPQFMLQRILREIDANQQHCINAHFKQYQITSEMIRELFYTMMMSATTYWDRTVIPGIIFRLKRCNANDVTALDFFFENYLGSIDEPPPSPNGPGFLFSDVLNFNIVQSEGWLALNESEVDERTLNGWYNATIIAPRPLTPYIQLRSQWPKYKLDQYAYRVASYSPLLMMSGTLDPAAPFHEVAQLASSTTNTRTFHAVTLAGHVTMQLAAAGYLCPLQLVLSWLFPALFPVEWRDPTCIQNLPKTIDFVGATDMGQFYSLIYLNVTQPFGK